MTGNMYDKEYVWQGICMTGNMYEGNMYDREFVWQGICMTGNMYDRNMYDREYVWQGICMTGNMYDREYVMQRRIDDVSTRMLYGEYLVWVEKRRC